MLPSGNGLYNNKNDNNNNNNNQFFIYRRKLIKLTSLHILISIKNEELIYNEAFLTARKW